MPVKPGPVLAIYDSQSTRLLALRVVFRTNTISLTHEYTIDKAKLQDRSAYPKFCAKSFSTLVR